MAPHEEQPRNARRSFAPSVSMTAPHEPHKTTSPKCPARLADTPPAPITRGNGHGRVLDLSACAGSLGRGRDRGGEAAPREASQPHAPPAALARHGKRPKPVKDGRAALLGRTRRDGEAIAVGTNGREQEGEGRQGAQGGAH